MFDNRGAVKPTLVGPARTFVAEYVFGSRIIWPNKTHANLLIEQYNTEVFFYRLTIGDNAEYKRQ